MDAQLIETAKADARYCYGGYKAFQPMEVSWAETVLILPDEFRQGNVPRKRPPPFIKSALRAGVRGPSPLPPTALRS